MRRLITLLSILYGHSFLFSATITSAGSGNWNAAATWVGGAVPSSTDNAVIANGHVVALVNNQTIVNVTINGNGVLNLSTNTRTLTVNGDFTMNGTSAINGNSNSRGVVIAGNLIIPGTGCTIQNVNITVAGVFSITSVGVVVLNTGNTASKVFGSFYNDGVFTNSANNVPLTINGDFTNNGTFTQGTGRVTFTGATSNTLTGTTASTGFGGGITINKGTSQANILEVTSVITMVNGGLILTNGTFKLSSASTLVPFTADPNIPVNARLWNNGGTMNSTASIDWTLLGYIQVSAGSINFGTAIDDRIAPNSSGATSGAIEITGGTLTVTGRISSGTNPWRYIMSGGTCSLGTLGNTTAGRDVFNLDNSTNGVFSMSGGTLVICNKGGAAGENLGYHNTASLGTGFTGGVLQMGTASTATGSIMRIETSIPIYNLVINAPSSTVQVQSPATPTTSFLQISNDLIISDGTFDISNQDIEISGDWTNASAVSDPLIEGTRKVTFDGSIAGQTITNTGSANGMVFRDIVFNNSFATLPQITLNTSMQAANGLTFTAGKVNLNANTFTLGTSAAAPGTLARTADYFYGGTFTRWFNTPSIAVGNIAGLFPMGTNQGDYRPLWVAYSANLTTGGVISAVHTATYPATYVAASHNDASWGNTLQGVSNSVWTISTSTLAFNGATGIVRYGGTGYGTNALSDLDASLAASVVGTHGAATSVNTTYEVNRTALTTANIANAWRIGTRNTAASPLPITLKSFEAIPANDQVVLNWQTLSEKNSDYFTLERSENGLEFSPFEKVLAAGNNSSLLSYQTIDKTPYEGGNYYRLKLTDKDGTEHTYKTVYISFLKNEEESLEIYPNPSASEFHLKVKRPEEIQNIEVFDSVGKKLGEWNEGTSVIHLESYEEGMYFLRISYRNKVLQQKIILERK